MDELPSVLGLGVTELAALHVGHHDALLAIIDVYDDADGVIVQLRHVAAGRFLDDRPMSLREAVLDGLLLLLGRRSGDDPDGDRPIERHQARVIARGRRPGDQRENRENHGQNAAASRASSKHGTAASLTSARKRNNGRPRIPRDPSHFFECDQVHERLGMAYLALVRPSGRLAAQWA